MCGRGACFRASAKPHHNGVEPSAPKLLGTLIIIIIIIMLY